jgi:hypothetical protein
MSAFKGKSEAAVGPSVRSCGWLLVAQSGRSLVRRRHLRSVSPLCNSGRRRPFAASRHGQFQSLNHRAGFDLAQMGEGRVPRWKRSHTNDRKTSFYADTPSGFFIEYGWKGRMIDPEAW